MPRQLHQSCRLRRINCQKSEQPRLASFAVEWDPAHPNRWGVHAAPPVVSCASTHITAVDEEQGKQNTQANDRRNRSIRPISAGSAPRAPNLRGASRGGGVKGSGGDFSPEAWRRLSTPRSWPLKPPAPRKTRETKTICHRRSRKVP